MVVNTSSTLPSVVCLECEYGAYDHGFCADEEISKGIIRNVPPGYEMQNNNLAVDFDGVLHNFDKGWYDGTCYGDPIPGSLDAIKSLSKKYNIIIFTSKCLPDRPLVDGFDGYSLVINWLSKHGFLNYIKEVTCIKPRAKYYIDDKAIKYDNNWEDIIEELLN